MVPVIAQPAMPLPEEKRVDGPGFALGECIYKRILRFCFAFLSIPFIPPLLGNNRQGISDFGLLSFVNQDFLNPPGPAGRHVECCLICCQLHDIIIRLHMILWLNMPTGDHCLLDSLPEFW